MGTIHDHIQYLKKTSSNIFLFFGRTKTTLEMTHIRLLLTCLLLCSVAIAHGQDDKDKPSILTLTAGWSLADFVLDDDVIGSTDPRNGFFVGARKDVKIIPMLFFNAGLLYTQQGAVFTGLADDITIKTNYIDIPVGLKFKIGPVFATGGISGNIKVSDNFNEIAGEGADAAELKGFDWAYSLGLGAKLSIFSLDLRWNNSFGDIVKDNDGGGELKNSYLLIGLGISLNR